ncbi:hypothetical protein T11_245 [Trichinella zimbabwensis]|uniref:Uncharacterized protein n=2 Tax=Trichinella TaxID=6333 RepID=A0A0V1MDL2_9BILA|nr:hypothetical protein T11_245 [Trichinella zimbabwensis]KRZ69570.1 hypothetical protein T10_11703 [Trichinella papuae]
MRMTITMSFATTMILFLLNVHSMFGITIKSRENNLSPSESGMMEAVPLCYPSEPCQFIIPRRDTIDFGIEYKVIPSWCHCPVNTACLPFEYDRRRKAKVYKCLANDKVSVSGLFPLNSK